MTIIDMQDPVQRKFFLAAKLKGQLKILKAGMTIRGLTKTVALNLAADITGIKYKAKQIDNAIADLQNVMDSMISVKEAQTIKLEGHIGGFQ